jgi:branched-chain amino acid transport system permease protein
MNKSLNWGLNWGMNWGMNRQRMVTAAIVVALLAAPWALDSYAISTMSRILVFGLLAMSVNLLTGVSGLPTLGQAAYFGVGAYTGALLARSVTEVGLVQIAAAAVLGAAVAAFTGLVAVRARGVVFLMITLAIGEMTYTAAVSWDSITAGSDGLANIPHVVPFWGMSALSSDGLIFYYILALFILLYAVLALFVRSPFGLSLRSIRDNETRMRALGYPVTGYLLAVYCVAGAVAGAAGAAWVSVQRFVSPGDLGFDVAALALLAVILGGIGSMRGACIGAALVVLTRDYLGGMFAGHGLLLLGTMFVVVVYLLPNGVAGFRFPRRQRHLTGAQS